MNVNRRGKGGHYGRQLLAFQWFLQRSLRPLGRNFHVISDDICEHVIAAVLCSPQSAIQNPQLLNVPPIHAATRTNTDVDPHRLRRRVK